MYYLCSTEINQLNTHNYGNNNIQKHYCAVKTTEKAILLQVRTSMEEEMTGKPANMWFPKSVIRESNGNYFVADWFANKNAEVASLLN